MGQRSDYGKGSSYMLSDEYYSGIEKGIIRNVNDDKEQNAIGMDYTIYRYLCIVKKIGCILGFRGDVAKQLRAQTGARISIGEPIPGCDERVVTMYSSSEETNTYENEYICPAQDALFRVHDKLASEEPLEVVVRLLVPSDQMGCVIGKGGQVIKSIRFETNAQIRVLGSDHLPPCALSTDGLIQINGEPTAVKKALYQVSFCLHDNPSWSQQSILNSPSIYKSGISLNNPYVGGTVGMTSYMGSYGNYKNGRDWCSLSKEFSVRVVCPTENIGAVIGKGGAFIKLIRQKTGAIIIVDTSGADEVDCIISVSSLEMFEAPSRTINAIMLLQPRCSEKKMETDLGNLVITTRLLVSKSRVGCIIGKGGAIIKEIRSTSRADIHISFDENIPNIAFEDDAVIQIQGNIKAVNNALSQVMQRLRANIFETPMESFDGNT